MTRALARLLAALALVSGVAAPAVAADYPINTVASYGSVRAFPIIGCDKSVPVSISSATTTQLVGLVASQVVYVCSFSVTMGGTAPTLTFEYGTGSSCGTGTTVLTGAFTPTAGSFLAQGTGLGTIFRTPAGNALCALTAGTPTVFGVLSYTQF